MKMGVILGVILGLLLLVVGGVGSFVTKKSGKKCKWCLWVLLACVCAFITAGSNALRFLM